MKKGEESKEKNKNQEDANSLWGPELGEFGIEYDFFITEDTRVKEKVANGSQAIEPIKRNGNRDESKEFFLPDFFSDDDES